MVASHTTLPPTTKPTPQQKKVDYDKWITRNEALDFLGCSYATLIDYENKDKVHPQRVYRLDRSNHQRMLFVYDPTELAKIPRRASAIARSPGEMAARVFELLDTGKSIREIVVELRETPDVVRGLREVWLDEGGADMVISSDARGELAKIVGPFSSVAELHQNVLQAVRQIK